MNRCGVILRITMQTAFTPHITAGETGLTSRLLRIPAHVYLVAAACWVTLCGILWDISWHISIGRDEFFSPPHILIYTGGATVGGWALTEMLRNTFHSASRHNNGHVIVFGVVRASLGGLCCLWGAVAMLASAVFDDWWHKNYGLDVEIFSPPHAVLAMGLLMMQLGAIITVLKYLNLARQHTYSSKIIYKKLLFLFITQAASLLCMLCTLLAEYVTDERMHHAHFYKVTAVIGMLVLPAAATVLRQKWAMTGISLLYALLLIAVNTVLQSFSVEPMLSPVLNPVTHFQIFSFPLLLFVPAFCMDIIFNIKRLDDWLKAALMAVVFVLLLVAVQWPFGSFLVQSPLARNWFFGGDAWPYNLPPDFEYRYAFSPIYLQPAGSFIAGCGIAVLLGFAVCRISLWWGRWMNMIKR